MMTDDRGITAQLWGRPTFFATDRVGMSDECYDPCAKRKGMQCDCTDRGWAPRPTNQLAKHAM
eukprot:7291017-Alexandrium_andersonii.AAC.1